MDLGRTVVISPTGIPKLVEEIREFVKERAVEEAKILYREGSKRGGLLSRQTREPMASYVARRHRWYLRLTGLDDALVIPERS